MRQRRGELLLGHVDGGEDDVRRLHVGENVAAGEIGVRVEETVGQRQQ